MRLGIISDCIHVRDNTGRIGSTNHVYVMQMNALASHFSNTVFCTPVIDAGPDTPPLSYYTQTGISFQPLPKAGGKTWRDKWHLLTMIPRWFNAFSILSKQVDIIYQRFPNNLNLPGFFYIYFKGIPAFATYTGTWLGYKGESITYRLQRWLLKKVYPGPVFVYDFAVKHPRIFPTISPSYARIDWEQETEMVKEKILRIKQRGEKDLLYLVSVGALTPYKNHILLLKACVQLKKAGQPFVLFIAGQGKLHDTLLTFIHNEGLQDQVKLLGVIPQEALRTYYRNADFVIQPSIIEGYGKVPVEAMFHGAVPLLSSVSIHPYFVGKNNERGALFELQNHEQLVESIHKFTSNLGAWENALMAARTFSKEFTTEAWTNSIITVLKEKGIYT
jgi:glycosyltransferase involved in cell wall biosynthesis